MVEKGIKIRTSVMTTFFLSCCYHIQLTLTFNLNYDLVAAYVFRKSFLAHLYER